MKKSNPIALLPIAVFLVLFIGFSVYTGDFYKMPAVVAFLIALIVALLQNKKLKLSEKLVVAAKGAGDENIMIMCLVFILAGAFSGTISAAGGVSSTVNLGLSIIPAKFSVIGLFVIGCFISTSMGTSVGTISALAPIALGISEKTSIPVAMAVGAVVCGAMFGDNLSIISDTTIAAVRTQGCEMKDKFRENFKIVLPAALITIIIFFVLTFNSNYQVTGDLSYNLLKVIPYIVVLVGALLGANVLLLLSVGTILAAFVGVFTGAFALIDTFSVIGNGISNMYEITIISIVVGAIFGLIRNNGGIDAILNLIKSKISSKKGAEFGIATLGALTDIATANNTVAIVIAGPIVKDISTEYDIEPKRSASLIDIFTSVFQGIIPYGAQLLTAASLTLISPIQILPYLYYPILMGISAILFIIFSKKK